MVRLLLQSGADVHARTKTGDSVFHLALDYYNENEALEVAKLLVCYGGNPAEANSSGKTSLHIAIKYGHISVARYLLSLGVPLPLDILPTLDPPDFNDDILCHWTARVVCFLVENGANVHAHNALGNSVLHVVLESLSAHRSPGVKLMELLVAYGCDPFEANSHGKTPLGIAVERGLYLAERYLRLLGACDLDEVRTIPHAGREWILVVTLFSC